MKLGRCTVENFGSYRNFELSFASLGLSLIYGPTGSGKSTIADMPIWILFGITGKEGAADEIRSWTTTDATRGSMEVFDSAGNGILVTRIRGGKENDLFWSESTAPDTKIRGKDLKDTQRLLEERIGMSSDLFLCSSYFSEFSDSGRFFMAKAKDRRAVFERIASLQFPIQLAEKASEARKQAKKELEAAALAANRQEGALNVQKMSVQDALFRAEQWDTTQNKLINRLEVSCANFAADQAADRHQLQLKYDAWTNAHALHIEALSESALVRQLSVKPTNFSEQLQRLDAILAHAEQERCPACGGPAGQDEYRKAQLERREVERQKTKNDELLRLIETDQREALRASQEVNPFVAQLERAEKVENHFAEQVQTERAKANPFRGQIEALKSKLEATTGAHEKAKAESETIAAKIQALGQIYDMSYDLRGWMLEQAVLEIEAETNRLLTKYFDAEIIVGFSLSGADNLDVSIQKSGYACSYKQLSRGQRSLLRLCFVVSLMKAAANNAGVHMDWMAFDEVLDGLNEDLKKKAFGVFEELAQNCGTVLLVDHCVAFQEMFNSRYRVELIEDASVVSEEQ